MHDLLSIRRKPRRRVSRRTDMADRGSGPAAPLPTGGSRHAAQDAARVRDAPATPHDLQANRRAGRDQRGDGGVSHDARAGALPRRDCGATAMRWTIWRRRERSEEHTSELQSLMRISYAVFCLKKKKNNKL